MKSGSFSRSLSLPNTASDEDVRATYRDGILEVHIPIDKAEAATHKIPVSRS